MHQRYQTYIPVTNGSFLAEWSEVCSKIERSHKSGVCFIKLNVFVNTENHSEYRRRKLQIEHDLRLVLNDRLPALAITSHTPESGFCVAVEAACLIEEKREVTYHSFDGIPYVLVDSRLGRQMWAAGLGECTPEASATESARAAMEKLRNLLAVEGFTMDHIVRQWNYVGDILKLENGFQNYQIFNEIRNEYYQQYRTCAGYPAATGIGMKLNGVLIDFCAIMPRENVNIVAVDNPKQVMPYAYQQQVLKGEIIHGKTKKQAPQFERAKLISNCKVSSLFISGTASIIGQETIGIEDVEMQTKITLENIGHLADQVKFACRKEHSAQFHVRFSVLRVYIKKLNDFDVVQRICTEKYGDIPIIYIQADICRDDLLVEIEAEMVSA